MEQDSLVLEIHDLDFISKPLREGLFATEYITRSLIIGGVILIGLVLLWIIDRMLTWAVNHKIDPTVKRHNRLPFFLFPAFFFASFIVDYITIIFGVYTLPYLSFAVFAIKGSYFTSTALWAMRMFDVPVGKLFGFLFSIIKAWRTKDIDDLNKSIENLSNSDNNIVKKTITVLILLFILSCLSPRQAIRQEYEPVNTSIEFMDTIKKDSVRKVYRSAFNAEYLVNKAIEKNKRRINHKTTIPVIVDSPHIEIVETENITDSTPNIKKAITQNENGVPISYRGHIIGKFKIKNK